MGQTRLDRHLLQRCHGLKSEVRFVNKIESDGKFMMAMAQMPIKPDLTHMRHFHKYFMVLSKYQIFATT